MSGLHVKVPRESAGALVGRPDLTDEEVHAAIRARLAFEGRSSPDPEIVLEAARLRKRKALSFLRKLVLPAPRSPLDMPLQPVIRAHLQWAGDDPGRKA